MRFAQNLATLAQAQQAQIDRMLQRIVQMMEVKDLDAAPILDVAHAMSEMDADPLAPRSSGAPTRSVADAVRGRGPRAGPKVPAPKRSAARKR